ncbi:precorrin-6y C5,15-methyltransferase (decarboxylating) subunit CbiE [Clostridium intestinale]|uniref:Precorrin-6y C5,15-methyltransferase (Decarboxylating) subunit CbiE n=1 Tax=Clostridium intestinale TaxID=36845 RepID=A0A7D6W0C2_9CLOT|nr:precorrin-6y C5,15-methyltransferase (decarboxylating) subunit CbiE [Clostridium intestinale]QLY79805.1 precorrin-6y C5,15-methyltransferase (decarboxylating) subunit CbiE [Clostridium intestinale]
MITLVGLGPGSKEYMLLKAMETLNNSSIVIGFSRAIESLDFISTPKVAVNNLKGIIEFIENNPSENISIVASGDPCFYGVLNYLKRNINEEITVIPGISSFQYLMSKLGKPWQEAKLSSLHGREGDFIKEVREVNLSIWLTDKINNPTKLAKQLHDEDIECTIYVGENLSYKDEKITIGSPKEVALKEFSELNIMVVERT